MAEDRLQVFSVLDADLQSLVSERPFPAVVAAGGQWEAVKPLKGGRRQWDEVAGLWEEPDWDEDGDGSGGGGGSAVEEEEEDGESGNGDSNGEGDEEHPGVQTQFVTGWAAAFGWDTALARLAKMPERLGDAFDRVYIAAPLLTA